jgi:hypothetical protein
MLLCAQDRVNVFDFVLVVTMVGALVAEHLNYYTASSILGYAHNLSHRSTNHLKIYKDMPPDTQAQKECIGPGHELSHVCDNSLRKD